MARAPGAGRCRSRHGTIVPSASSRCPGRRSGAPWRAGRFSKVRVRRLSLVQDRSSAAGRIVDQQGWGDRLRQASAGGPGPAPKVRRIARPECRGQRTLAPEQGLDPVHQVKEAVEGPLRRGTDPVETAGFPRFGDIVVPRVVTPVRVPFQDVEGEVGRRADRPVPLQIRHGVRQFPRVDRVRSMKPGGRRRVRRLCSTVSAVRSNSTQGSRSVRRDAASTAIATVRAAVARGCPSADRRDRWRDWRTSWPGRRGGRWLVSVTRIIRHYMAQKIRILWGT